MQIMKVNLRDMKPAEYNPRKTLRPGDTEYDNIKNSIENFGLVEPIIWNKRTGNIVGGHQRYAVLLDKGVEETDVSVVDINETDEKLLNVALNKIAGIWDNDKLNELFSELLADGIDVGITGFSGDEVDCLINSMVDINIDSFFGEKPEKESKAKEVTCPHCGETFEL